MPVHVAPNGHRPTLANTPLVIRSLAEARSFFSVVTRVQASRARMGSAQGAHCFDAADSCSAQSDHPALAERGACVRLPPTYHRMVPWEALPVARVRFHLFGFHVAMSCHAMPCHAMPCSAHAHAHAMRPYLLKTSIVFFLF